VSIKAKGLERLVAVVAVAAAMFVGNALLLAVIMPVEMADKLESSCPESHVTVTVVARGLPPDEDAVIVPVIAPAETMA
jgi:hypothetical protein